MISTAKCGHKFRVGWPSVPSKSKLLSRCRGSKLLISIWNDIGLLRQQVRQF